MSARLRGALVFALLLGGCATEGGTGGAGYDWWYYDPWYGAYGWYGAACCADFPDDIGPPRPEHPIAQPPGTDGARPSHPIANAPGDGAKPSNPIASQPKAASSTSRSMSSPRPAAMPRGGGMRGGGGRR